METVNNQRLMQYGSGSEHGQVYHEFSRISQAGRHGGVRRRNALEAVVKDTTIDYNAWRHNALAAQRHTTDNALALLRAKRQWATMTILTLTCHALRLIDTRSFTECLRWRVLSVTTDMKRRVCGATVMSVWLRERIATPII